MRSWCGRPWLRPLWRLLVVCVFVPDVGCQGGGGSDAPLLRDRPADIIVVMIDTVRTDHLGLFGYEKNTSPEIEAFAKVATDYRRAYAQSSWTAPSVASFLTSRYPREVGVHHEPRKLRPGTRTLARVLREHNYRTEAVLTNRYISTRYGHGMAFDHVDERYISKGAAVSSSRVTDAALARVREADRDKPLFLYVHYFDPHYDYVVHEEFGLGAPEFGPVPHGGVVSFMSQKLRRSLTEFDMLESRKHYDSEIAFTDHHVGRLLTGLSALGRFDDAVVVVLSDHGEEFLDHGQIGHSSTLYDELIHVPLLIKAPGQKAGVREERAVPLLNAAPTILELAGLPPEPNHLGVSMRRAPEHQPIFTATFHYTEKAAVIYGRYKAIIDYRENTFEVYDLAVDPHEQHSIAAERPVFASFMRWRLEAWHEGRFVRQGGRAVHLSEQEKAIMRSLGYGE